MHSYYMLEKWPADRRQELLRDAHSHNLAAELRQPWAAKLPNWWAAARRSGRLRCGATVMASATVATS
jgi:hypothetical protein